jgi:signal transduction histidine kinase
MGAEASARNERPAEAALERDDRPPKANGSAPSYSVPTQLIILALVAVLVVPGIAFAGLLLGRYAHSERARYELESVDVARAASTALDRYLNGLQTTLQTLSTSPFLAAGDLEGFHQQAERIKSFIGADIGLRRPDGQQLINTRLPWGAALPPTPLAVDAQVIATGKPLVSDVFTGTVANRPLVAIILPVRIGGELKYLLHISSETDRFHDVVASVVPDNWLIGVGDRGGTYVTRSENHSEFTGKPGVPSFLARASAFEGTFVGENAYGDKVLVGYIHSALANWLVAANIKQSVIEAPLTEALYVLVAFGALTLLVASMIALWLWRFVARPLEGLAVASRQVGKMQSPIPIETSLREFAVVRDALSAAHEQVRSHNDLLEARVAERTCELAQANAELTAQMTAREKAESQLRQMQKMEAVGQLTGGIAHDFNNMLSIVISSLNLLQRRLERGDTDVQRFVASAMEGANRAAALTSRLLAFSRQQPLAPEVLDANELVAGMSELLQRTLGEPIRIETVLTTGLWKTYADAAQIENAILNLAVNARDAMPEGGHLTIETGNACLDEAYTEANDDARSGQYVNISVSDTGIGMSADVVGSAFEPFFTTKKIGMGTGLGLSQVYGFVKQSNGHIKIYSEPGHGTTIRIYLPRYYGEAALKPLRRAARPLLAGSPQHVILVVEDESRLRQLAVETLTELGYAVLAAGSAKEALDLIDKHPEISLLFTDIVMPDMGGDKLADEAIKRRPNLRVLYTTGFARNAVVHDGVLDTGVDFIAKPFVMEELAEKIHHILI